MTSELIRRVRLADAVDRIEQMMVEIDHGEEITDAMIESFSDARAAIATKVDGWIMYLDGIKAMTTALKEKSDRARSALKSCESLHKRLREYLAFYLAEHPGVPFKGDEGTLYLHRSPKSLKVSYEGPSDDKGASIGDRTVYNFVPDALLALEPSIGSYTKTITLTVLDKEKLRADLEAGMKLPWARIEQNSHVRVKG